MRAQFTNKISLVSPGESTQIEMSLSEVPRGNEELGAQGRAGWSWAAHQEKGEPGWSSKSLAKPTDASSCYKMHIEHENNGAT